ncbi:MAG: TatD family hydrolase [Lentisphaerae bacterium]|nr:TatD family hydrolase [Lentisphaerota bacterium]
MKPIDSHSHFSSDTEFSEHNILISRALEAGLGSIVAVGGDPDSNRTVLSLATQHTSFVYATIGLSRELATNVSHTEFLELNTLLSDYRPVIKGIGETGLDFYYQAETADPQKKLFEKMLELAVTNNLPAVVHSRAAQESTIDILKSYVNKTDSSLRGVLHCFTGDYSFAKQLLDLNFYISFSGILTFKNSAYLRDIAAKLPEDKILIETDSPYLAPVPFRGKTNEPAFLSKIAECLAMTRQCSYEHALTFTATNTRKLFNI